MSALLNASPRASLNASSSAATSAAPCDAWAFAQVDEFWERYAPLTPWGKDGRDAKLVLTERDDIEARYDDIDAALAYLKAAAGDPSSLDRGSYHLKRMPRIPLGAQDGYELLELFQIKKFIANYKGVMTTLGSAVAGRFGLEPFGPGSAAALLASELDRGGSDPETFYLADSYDDALPDLRSAIRAADVAIAVERGNAEAEAKRSFGLSFDGREFVVAPKDLARSMTAASCESGGRYALEPYDDGRYIVRIMPSAAAVDAMADRERLLEQERSAEARVIVRLSAMAAAAAPELERAVGSVSRWDRARAGAVLAIERRMTRPVLDSAVSRLVDARFVPCEDECERMGLRYSPLSACFEADAVVLFGSNMGGKTVVLKTALFFQLIAQAGLFVPASRFETRVYSRVEYVGELSGERLAGLSGFGLEVWRLERAWSAGSRPAGESGRPLDESPGGNALVAFDELARTTGSHEAEALLSAVVEAYAERGRASGGRGDRAFFATHFRGVARMSGVEYRRMRGLDKAGAEASLRGGSQAAQRLTAPGGTSHDNAAGLSASLTERLAGINMHMRYEVVDDDGSGTESDALAIASFLGLDRSIVERARAYVERNRE